MDNASKKRIPYCPLLSSGAVDLKVCLQEDCAWYNTNTKTCIASIFAHNTLIYIKQKQGR